jgi:hypothetical protein
VIIVVDVHIAFDTGATLTVSSLEQNVASRMIEDLEDLRRRRSKAVQEGQSPPALTIGGTARDGCKSFVVALERVVGVSTSNPREVRESKNGQG